MEEYNITYLNVVFAISLVVLSMGIVPVSCDSDGLAIIAVRTTAVGNLGHVGVGFQNDDDTWTIGGVEGDPDKTILWGAVVPPIFGDNGGWVEEHKTLQEVAVIFHSLDYDGLKIIQVIDDDPNLANFQIKSFPTRGYNVVNNNCLSATIDVLSAYGVKHLPLQITNVAPNDYYAHVQGDEEYLWDSNKKMYTNIVSGSSLIRIDQKSPQEALAAAKETMARAYANRDEIQPEAVPETSSQASKSPVTLTLYVHDGNPNGPIIPGATVTGHDGSGNNFQQTTGSNGYVTITGVPGTWSFSASASGYETNNWDQDITETDRKDAFLQQESAKATDNLHEASYVSNQPPNLLDLSPDKPSPQYAGDVIKWSAKASDQDKDALLYKFWLKGLSTSGAWMIVQDWSPSNQWIWNSASADSGDYTVYVYIRDGKHAGPDDYDKAIGRHYRLDPIVAGMTSVTPAEAQSPESSVVGKWAGHTELPTHGLDNPLNIDIYEDGTFSSDKGGTGKWEQEGDNIRWQWDLSDEDLNSGSCSFVYEGTISGNTMSGTSSCVLGNPLPVCGYWDAVKIDTTER